MVIVMVHYTLFYSVPLMIKMKCDGAQQYVQWYRVNQYYISNQQCLIIKMLHSHFVDFHLTFL